ncbi:hypothetical protein SLE2022_196650 [Rubroshorea leprosula]
MATYKQPLALPPALGSHNQFSSCSSARVLDEEEPLVPTTAPCEPDSVVTSITGTTPAAGAAATGAVGTEDLHHPLVFYMHDILGGSNLTARAVTGIVTNPAINGQVPFAKPNGPNLPVNNGISINSNNNGVLNNNNVPFLTGLGGNSANVIQSNGNNQINGLGDPVLSGGRLPAGSTI